MRLPGVGNTLPATLGGSDALAASGVQAAGAAVRRSGPGSATLSGSIGELTAELSSSGDLDADEADAQRATVKARGPGGIALAASRGEPHGRLPLVDRSGSRHAG